jgi:DNA modification methylase
MSDRRKNAAAQPGAKLRLEWVEAGSLTANPRNWRKHPDAQMAAIKGLIADPEVGWAGALLFNERTGRLIDGHARQRVVDPKAVVPVLIGSWSEEAEKRILLTLDPIAGMAVADIAQLESLLSEVNLSDEWLAGLRDQLDRVLADSQRLLDAEEQAAGVIEDEVPAPPDEAVTKRGDFIQLGEHRLMCGDSGNADDINRLLESQPVHLINTDPPYNVQVEPRSRNATAAGLSTFSAYLAEQSGKPVRAAGAKMRPKDRPLQNDFLSEEEFTQRLDAWFGQIARVLLPGRSFYIWGGWSNVGNYPAALKRAGLFWHQQIIWVKNAPVLCRKDFMLAHEWCFYGWREGAGHEFFGPNNLRDVWLVNKVAHTAMVHLTEKPVELAARAILYSSRPGENVLDLFGGSGSTLIAAEQTKRRAFLMELDPLYCDVIVQRWEKFTGRNAERSTAQSVNT